MDTINKSFSDLEILAKLMDDQFELFGFHFGINFLIDLLPEIGDVVTTIIALYIFFLMFKYRVSIWIRFRMMLNIAIYFLIGLIPWLGDVFGAWWKPNRRNVRLLQKTLY